MKRYEAERSSLVVEKCSLKKLLNLIMYDEGNAIFSNGFFMYFRLTQKGLPHCVYTGVAIKYKDSIERFTEVTAVYMNYLTDDEINAYIQTGEPQWVLFQSGSALRLLVARQICTNIWMPVTTGSC